MPVTRPWPARSVGAACAFGSDRLTADGAKPPSSEACEPEPEATIEVLTKSALETPIPTTPTLKSKLALNESLGDHIDLTDTDSEDCEAEVTPAVRDRKPTRRYSPRVSAIKRESISSDSKRYALEWLQPAAVVPYSEPSAST